MALRCALVILALFIFSCLLFLVWCCLVLSILWCEIVRSLGSSEIWLILARLVSWSALMYVSYYNVQGVEAYLGLRALTFMCCEPLWPMWEPWAKLVPKALSYRLVTELIPLVMCRDAPTALFVECYEFFMWSWALWYLCIGFCFSLRSWLL